MVQLVMALQKAAENQVRQRTARTLALQNFVERDSYCFRVVCVRRTDEEPGRGKAATCQGEGSRPPFLPLPFPKVTLPPVALRARCRSATRAYSPSERPPSTLSGRFRFAQEIIRVHACPLDIIQPKNYTTIATGRAMCSLWAATGPSSSARC